MKPILVPILVITKSIQNSLLCAIFALTACSTQQNTATGAADAQNWSQEEVDALSKAIPALGSTIPAPREKDHSWMSLKEWYGFHEEDKRIAQQGDIDVLLIGDSITHAWPPELLEQYLPNQRIANFAIGGDQTQTLLWRLQNGAVGQLSPKLIVQMIGVNNMYDDEYSPQFVFYGVKNTTAYVKESFPNSKILLLAILPNKTKDSKQGREYVVRVNNMIETLSEEKQISFKDYGALFLDETNEIPLNLMADRLHPTRLGYEKWIIPLASDIKALLASE